MENLYQAVRGILRHTACLFTTFDRSYLTCAMFFPVARRSYFPTARLTRPCGRAPQVAPKENRDIFGVISHEWRFSRVYPFYFLKLPPSSKSPTGAKATLQLGEWKTYTKLCVAFLAIQLAGLLPIN